MKGFVSYAHDDVKMARELRTHLASVERSLDITFWLDDHLRSGDHWDRTIKHAIDSADIFLLLLSHHFMSSDYIINNEVPEILRRSSKSRTLIIPVLLQRCGWKDFFGSLQAVPVINGREKPIADWEPNHDGYDQAREQISKSIKECFAITPKPLSWPDQLIALEQDEGGIYWIKQGDQLVPESSGKTTGDTAVATDPIVRQQHADVIVKSTAFAEIAARLANQIGWDTLATEARRLRENVQGPSEEIPERIGAIYGSVITLASFLEQNVDIRSRISQDLEPLDIDIERNLSNLVGSGAIWIRQFPSARRLDDALAAFAGPEDRYPLAQAIIKIASGSTLTPVSRAGLFR